MMFIDRKIPGVMMVHGPDYTHHTSDDTPDKVDPVELARSEMIAAGTVVFLSNLATNEALDLVYLAGANATQRLGQAGRNAARLVLDSPPDRLPDFLREAMIVIDENARVAKEGLATTLWFNGETEIQRATKKSNEQIGAYAGALLEEVKQDAAMRLGKKSVPTSRAVVDNRVPVRLTRGPLDFGLPESKLAQAREPYQLNGDVRFEIVNFIDGKRTMAEIKRCLIGEFGRAAVARFDRFIEDLVTVGVVKWK
jgi:hypothetical protein